MPNFQICHPLNYSSYDRPLCRDTDTLTTVLRYLSQASSKTAGTQSRTVFRTISRFFVLIVSAVCQGVGRHDQQQENKKLCKSRQCASRKEQATRLSYWGVLSGEVVLQQTFSPAMATVVKRERSSCFKHVAVWRLLTWRILSDDGMVFLVFLAEWYGMDPGT